MAHQRKDYTLIIFTFQPTTTQQAGLEGGPGRYALSKAFPQQPTSASQASPPRASTTSQASPQLGTVVQTHKAVGRFQT